MKTLMIKKINKDEYLVESKVNGNRLLVDSDGLNKLKDLVNDSHSENHFEDEYKEVINYIYSEKEPHNEDDIFHVQWHITDRCNLRCKHCYQMDYTALLDNSFEDNVSIFEKLLNYASRRGKQLELSLTGGEPLLEKNLFRLIKYTKSKVPNIRIFLLTNGTLLKNNISQIIECNLTGVQISLDGSNNLVHDSIRGAGSYDKALEAIKCLVDNKIYTSVHTVLQKDNVKDIDNMVYVCDKLNVSRLTFSRLVPIGNSTNRLDSFLSSEEIRKVYHHLYDLKVNCGYSFINLERDLWQIIDSDCGSTCPAGTSSITLLRDGTIVPCRRVPIDIGNIKKSPLDEILFYSKTIEDFEACSPDECKSCKILSTCKGGCQAISFALYRKIGVYSDPQCWLKEDRVASNRTCDHEFEYISGRDCYVRKNEHIKSEV